MDVRHAEFAAMADVFLGPDYDPMKRKQIEGLQFDLHRQQSELADRHERGQLNDEEYLNGLNTAIEETCKQCEQILGAKDFRELFGVSPHEAPALIDRAMFLGDSSISEAAKTHPPPAKSRERRARFANSVHVGDEITKWTNPFYVGGPVPFERFVGRTGDVNAAFDQIRNRSHLALYGNTGTGKSSLLKYLTAPEAWKSRGLDPSEAVVVYVDCAALGLFTPEAFYREVLGQLREKVGRKLGTEIADMLKDTSVEGRDHLHKVLRKIGKSKRYVVLLLNDYDFALRPHDQYTEAQMLIALYGLRGLALHPEVQPHFTSVVTSFRRLNELGPKQLIAGSPWYNLYAFRPVKPFTQEEAAQVFDAMPAEWALTAEQRHAVREIAGGHPALLQAACYLICEGLASGRNPVADGQQFHHDFVGRTNTYFRNTWNFSTDTEQMLLLLIALSHLEGRLSGNRKYSLRGIDKILSQNERELRDLEDRGIIEQKAADGHTVYGFTSAIMEWWVIQEIEKCKDESELQQREKVLLNLSRKDVEQIKGVLREVWKQKDAITSVVKWVGNLVGAFTKAVAGSPAP